MMTRTRIYSLISFLVIVGAAVYAYKAWQPASPDEQLRDTSSLAVENLSWEITENRYVVNGTLANHDARDLVSAIIVLELREPDGHLVSTNPMLEILTVSAHTEKPFTAALAAKNASEQASVDAKVAVARWGKSSR